MEINDKLKNFINENIDLMNENTKESWAEIYSKIPQRLAGEFTQTILDAGINDPAEIMGYIPNLYLYLSEISNYKIPDNVTSIGDYAFNYCHNLTSITIPNSVKNIGWQAFSTCHLNSIIIPDSVISIGREAFLLSHFNRITIGNSVTSIGNSAFKQCGNLTSVTFAANSSLTTIGKGAFAYCDNLMSIIIPDSVSSIGDLAFSDCTNLTSVTIGNGVTNIGSVVFSNCRRLKKIHYKGTKKQAIQSGLEIIVEDPWNDAWSAGSSIEEIICTDGVIKL